MSTANKLTYLNSTKQAIKQAINEDFEVIDNNTTFREYADEISSNNAKYKDLIPKETKNATNTLDISNSAGLDKALVTQYGNSYQETTTGKNLFNQDNISSIGSEGGTYSNGVITTNQVTSSGTSNFVVYSNNSITLTPNTYYLSMDIRIKSGTGSFNKTNDGITDWTSVSRPTLSTTFQRYVYSHTYTSNKNFDRMLIQFISSTNAVYEITNIMLSTSSDTNYEKYTGGNPAPNPDYPQEIVNISGKSTLKDVGKNLFDISKVERGASYSYGTSGSVPTSSSSDARATLSPNNAIKVQPNTTYTFNHNSTWRISLGQLTSGKVSLGDSGWKTSSAMPLTITTGATCEYVGFNFSKSDNSTITDNDWNTFINSEIQLEESSTATTYEAYKEQSYTINLGDIELCKIGDYKDRIYYSSGKWYLEKNIGNVVLDGSENWQYYTGNVLFLETITDYLQTTGITCICNYYLTQQNPNSTLGMIDKHIAFRSSGSKLFYIKDTTYSDSGTFKNWLSTHNTEVYYPLATSTTTEITENNYPTLYNQLNNIKLYEGVNHITMTNESGLDVEFDIEYYKDWKLD